MKPETLTEYLNQNVVWSSKESELAIADMDVTYRRRACDWLLRNVEGLLQLYILEQYEARYAETEREPTLADKLRWADLRPYSWIKRTPLFLALSEGLPPELLRRQGGR